MTTRAIFSSLAFSSAAYAGLAALTATLAACSAAPVDEVDTNEMTADRDPAAEAIGSTQQPLMRGGGGTGGSTCVDRWQSCYVGCGVKHPEGDMRDGCEDSCDAAYRLCTIYGGGGIIMR